MACSVQSKAGQAGYRVNWERTQGGQAGGGHWSLVRQQHHLLAHKTMKALMPFTKPQGQGGIFLTMPVLIIRMAEEIQIDSISFFGGGWGHFKNNSKIDPQMR